MRTSAGKVPAAATRFVVRCLLGLAAVLALGAVLNILLLAIASGLGRGNAADAGARSSSNWESAWEQIISILEFVTETAATVGWLILPAMVAWLLVRRIPRLATYLALTAVGSHVLSAVGPLLVQLAHDGRGVNFFDGGAIGGAVTSVALLLVFLPTVPNHLRGTAAAASALLVIVIGVLRVAVGSGHPDAILGGSILGLGWLAVTSIVFRRWRHEEGLERRPFRVGLAPEDRAQLIPAPAHDTALPGGWRRFGLLVAAAIIIGTILTGAGLLIAQVLVPVQHFDAAVVEWFASIRTETLTVLATILDHLGNTPGILAVLLFAVPLALAITRRWAPALFLLTAAVGETTLYLLTAAIVGRPRPSVDHLWMGVPPTSSFPSGHVAASLVTYGGIALLLVAWNRGRLRYLAVVVAVVIVLGVVFSRLYWGMHFPTDALVSVLYGSGWLAVCWWAFRPGRRGEWGSVLCSNQC